MTEPAHHSVESEQSVVACAIRSAEGYDTAAQLLKAEDFYFHRERAIWEAVSALREQNKPVDPVTVSAALAPDAVEDATAYLLAICNAAPHNAKSYAQIVRDYAKARNLAAAGVEITTAAQSDIPLDEKIELSQKTLSAVVDETVETGFRKIADVAMQALEELDARIRNDGQLPGMATGYEDLDAKTGGLMPGDLFIIAGRPSQGKTMLAMNMVEHVAKSAPVLVFSLEMPAVALGNRMIASLGRINFDDVRHGRIPIDDPRLAVAAREFAGLKLWIDDRGGVTIDQIRSRARVAAREHGCKLIVVDYLGLVQAQGERQDLRIGAVSAGLKNLAKELNVPVVALAQLNRSVDSRTDRRPMMSDLRDSGSIEQDADVIGFIYLEEKYDADTHMKGIGELLIRKQRNGETGSLYFDFKGHHQRYDTRREMLPTPAKKEKRGRYEDL